MDLFNCTVDFWAAAITTDSETQGTGVFTCRRFFDLSYYKVVILDQRGCGRSTPRGCLAENNTAALVSDLDTLRQHLGIDKWMLFGGSWGVTLSLAYAAAHPQR
jgi:proline iminopeptidase